MSCDVGEVTERFENEQREEQRLRTFDKKMLRNISEAKRYEITGE